MKRVSSIRIVYGLLGLTLLATIPASAEMEPQSVAIVCLLEGKVQARQTPELPSQPLQLFDWLTPGTQVTVPRGGKAILAFRSGARYELPAGSTGRLTETQVTAETGQARLIETVAPWPEQLPPAIARSGEAVSRFRADHLLQGLYPRNDSKVPASQARLRFIPHTFVGRYRVEIWKIEETIHRMLYQTEIETPELTVPQGVLLPGQRYFWVVKGITRDDVSVEGEARFATLSDEDAQARLAIRQSLGGRRDAASLTLLAELDRRWGLLAEAHQGFRDAADLAPGNAALRAALDRCAQELN